MRVGMEWEGMRCIWLLGMDLVSAFSLILSGTR